MINVGGTQQMSAYFEKFNLDFTAQRGPHYCSVCTSRNTHGDPSLKAAIPNGEPANRRVQCAQMPLWELGVCTAANRATSGVHKCIRGIGCCAQRRSGNWLLCTPVANVR
jgi:hypothetical protein